MPLSQNRFQLAVFGSNVSHGCTISSAAGGIAVEWEESLAIARTADRLGLEAIIPVCRWKGFGGPSAFNHRSFETWTWAAGLAQATGLSQGKTSELLKILAPIVMAFIAQRISSGGQASAGGLSQILGEEKQQVQQAGGIGGGLLGRIIDQDGDGQFGVSDLIKLGSGLLGSGKR